jgi:hypothetical protein
MKSENEPAKEEAETSTRSFEDAPEANGKSVEAESNDTEASEADASAKMQPCFMMSTFTLKCDFSLKGGLLGEFSLASVQFE